MTIWHARKPVWKATLCNAKEIIAHGVIPATTNILVHSHFMMKSG